MRSIALAALAICALTVGAIGARQRPTELNRFDALVGKWSLDIHIREPKELEGHLKGSLSATWALNRQYVELDAKIPVSGHPEQPPIHAKGFLTFDDAAPYADRRYRIYLISSGDGRCLPLEGMFNNGKLRLHGRPISAEADPLKVKVEVTFASRNRIEIAIDGMGEGDKSWRLGEIKLSRKA